MQQTLPVDLSRAQAKLKTIKKLMDDDAVCCFCESWLYMNIDAILENKWVCQPCLLTHDNSVKNCPHCGRKQVALVETKKRMPT